MRVQKPDAATGVQDRPRIGLALGSGSARGLAHIGVLRALRQAGLSVAAISGCSIGALVGVMAAAGRLDDLEAAFRSMDRRGILALLDPVFPRAGLIDGKKVERFLAQMLPVGQFHELPTPFRAVATDLLSGEEVTLASGPLIDAIHASFAVPGLFTPCRLGKRILVDGGLVNPVPVNIVREMGADWIVAVDLNHDIVQKRMAPLRPDGATPRQARPPLPSIVESLQAALYITQARLTATSLAHEPPHLLIRPPLGDIRFMAFDRAGEIIEIGYRSACEALEQLMRADGMPPGLSSPGASQQVSA